MVKQLGIEETGVLVSCSDYHIFKKMQMTRRQMCIRDREKGHGNGHQQKVDPFQIERQHPVEAKHVQDQAQNGQSAFSSAYGEKEGEEERQDQGDEIIPLQAGDAAGQQGASVRCRPFFQVLHENIITFFIAGIVDAGSGAAVFSKMCIRDRMKSAFRKSVF